MKLTNRVLATFSLIAALSPLSMIAREPATFKIPFGFTVGMKTLAAGSYTVAELAPNVLRIQSNSKPHNNLCFVTYPDGPAKVAGVTTLGFHRYGNQYFLTRMSDPNRGWKFRESAHEKELIANSDALQRLSVIASSK